MTGVDLRPVADAAVRARQLRRLGVALSPLGEAFADLGEVLARAVDAVGTLARALARREEVRRVHTQYRQRHR